MAETLGKKNPTNLTFKVENLTEAEVWEAANCNVKLKTRAEVSILL